MKHFIMFLLVVLLCCNYGCGNSGDTGGGGATTGKKVTEKISPDKETVARLDDGAYVTIPAGAVDNPTEVKLEAKPFSKDMAIPTGLAPCSKVYQVVI